MNEVEVGFFEKNLVKIKQKLKDQDIVLKNPIASGSFGTAYNIDDPKKVLKITTDKDEAITSSKLIGKKFKNIVKIFRVFKFKSMPKIHFILQEKLKSLPANEANILKKVKLPSSDEIDIMLKEYKLYKKYNDLDEFLDKETSFTEQDREKIANFFESFNKYLRDFPLSARFFLLDGLKIVIKDDQFAEKLFEEDILEKALRGIFEMYKNNIYFEDTHVGNLMQDSKGNCKWIDLGVLSSAPGTKNIETIDALRKNRSFKKNNTKERIDMNNKLIFALKLNNRPDLVKKVKNISESSNEKLKLNTTTAAFPKELKKLEDFKKLAKEITKITGLKLSIKKHNVNSSMRGYISLQTRKKDGEYPTIDYDLGKSLQQKYKKKGTRPTLFMNNRIFFYYIGPEIYENPEWSGKLSLK